MISPRKIVLPAGFGNADQANAVRVRIRVWVIPHQAQVWGILPTDERGASIAASRRSWYELEEKTAALAENMVRRSLSARLGGSRTIERSKEAKVRRRVLATLASIDEAERR